ncbi:MAG: gliding motility lipoprotein GldB [Eudoraea sp.]|nr:gliding motility lipoprotein GldB [Eudoraea sp.]
MYRRGLFFLLIFLMLFGCAEEHKVADEVADIHVDMEVLRFDQEFLQATSGDIPRLKQKYPYLFPTQYPDSIWEAKLTDTLQLEILNEISRTFPDFKEESDKLELLFKHVKYYFPEAPLPKVVTLPSDVDYRNRVILADSLLLIGLDSYLGEDHKFYEGIERYIAAGLDKNYLISDVAGTFANKMLRYPTDRSFLARMIYYGKRLYIIDRLIPMETDAVRIRYRPEELDWARANEEEIWRYFVEREVLYSTENELDARFLLPAPFSKFRLELVDNESPDRLGRYIGWQIVKAFMNSNDISLHQMINLPAEEIFKRSNYKPEK